MSADKSSSKGRRKRADVVVEEEVFSVDDGWKIDLDSTQKARRLPVVALLKDFVNWWV